jgi:phosphopantothenoylcysteine decarboxylase
MNILLGLTGSVATTLAPKLFTAFKQMGEVKIVVTESARPFMDNMPYGCGWYTDEDEWEWPNRPGPDFSGFRRNYEKDDPVLHIELREWADVFVIAPLTVNTLAKIANGICDNLLTSIFRAWDWNRPVVVAPAANTLMWQSPFTAEHLQKLQGLFNLFHVVPPISKMLACKQEGEGAMAQIDDIVSVVEDSLRWEFPLNECNGIPVGNHPGAFGFNRKQSHHTGVDLYVPMPVGGNVIGGHNGYVKAMENGDVVCVERFTGPQDATPWWNNTDCMVVRGRHTICYGEIDPYFGRGQRVKQGQIIGEVIPVLPEGKERPDIPGHSRTMLHIELYTSDRNMASTSWGLDQPIHDYLLDPTPLLLNARNAPSTLRMTHDDLS